MQQLLVSTKKHYDHGMVGLVHVTGGNVDYGSGPYTVTIPAGNITSVSFEVKINDDNILEDNETFGLAINSSALPQCISLTGPYRTTVTIVDDDGKSYSTYRYVL